MTTERRRAFLRQGAVAFKRQQEWLARNGHPTTPLRRITKAESDRGVPGFITHGDRDPGRRSDPGAGFPWAEWFDACRSAISTPTPPTVKGPVMLIVKNPNGNDQYLTWMGKRWKINTTEELASYEKVCARVVLSAAAFARLQDA